MANKAPTDKAPTDEARKNDRFIDVLPIHGVVERQKISDARGLQATFFGRYEIQATFFGKSNWPRLPMAPKPLLELIKTCAIQKVIAGVAMPVATRLVSGQKDQRVS